MTRTGQNRLAYRAVEQAPSRFTPAYAAWAKRADNWAQERGL